MSAILEKLDLRSGDGRFHTRTSWLDSRHSFSFANHFDPSNTHHGLLLVSNDDVIRPGTGFSTHPHKDMEIVTWVLRGEVEHRDSSGGGGKIGPGDVQWMTAASGLVHEEFHGREFARRGGVFEVVQLWVNLPAKDKTAPPAYQTLVSSQIPMVAIPQGRLRVIAGTYGTAKGPARTFTPIQVWDISLTGNGFLELPLQEGHSAALVVLQGSVRVNGATALQLSEVGIFDHAGDTLHLEAGGGSRLLLLSGEPIQEPIAGGGPFVMNTPQEIRQAYDDYQNGSMGRLGE